MMRNNSNTHQVTDADFENYEDFPVGSIHAAVLIKDGLERYALRMRDHEGQLVFVSDEVECHKDILLMLEYESIKMSLAWRFSPDFMDTYAATYQGRLRRQRHRDARGLPRSSAP